MKPLGKYAAFLISLLSNCIPKNVEDNYTNFRFNPYFLYCSAFLSPSNTPSECNLLILLKNIYGVTRYYKSSTRGHIPCYKRATSGWEKDSSKSLKTLKISVKISKIQRCVRCAPAITWLALDFVVEKLYPKPFKKEAFFDKKGEPKWRGSPKNGR